MDAISNADPTGFLSAGVAAVKLVGAVAKAAPHVKHAVDNVRGNSTQGGNAGLGGNHNLGRSVSANDTSVSLRVDPEQEARAYETVNYVLRTLGSRMGAAGIVSAPALAKALTQAASQVELFSVNANRLFKSLESRLRDAVLVNSVFTSIYFIGAITAELSSTLPNYKAAYPQLGPFIVQQIFRAAIGEDAFRENLTANLDAYKTLATTAGLLRPTNIGYPIFPNFPTLTPTRYSSKSFTDVKNHKNIFEKLIKHFDVHGFPQPLPGRDVGPIKDWRFLSGDASTRAYEVEKADKHIGGAIGRVLYWLICSADRMPHDMGVIAYYKQHIELIQWMGTRFGFRVLHGATDLDLGGPHLRLENKYRATIEAWVIVMSSESARANEQQAATQWNQALPASPLSTTTSNGSNLPGRMSVDSSVSSVDTSAQSDNGLKVNTGSQGITPGRALGMGAVMAHAGQAARLSSHPKPGGNPSQRPQSTVSSPGMATVQPVASQPISPASNPSLVASPASLSTPATPGLPELSGHATSPFFNSATMFTPSISSTSTSPLTASSTAVPPTSNTPSYFPPTNNTNIPTNASQPGMNRRASVIPRKKAPPPPRKFPTARALYDHIPEEEGGDDLVFHEGDELEILEQTEELQDDGWCKARVKGTSKVGLAPLEYIEIIKVAAKPPPKPPGPSTTGAVRSASMPYPTGSPAPAFGLPPSGAMSPVGAQNAASSLSRDLSASRGVRSASTALPAGHTAQSHLIGIHSNQNQNQGPGVRPNMNTNPNHNMRPQSMAPQNMQNHPPLNQPQGTSNQPRPASQYPPASQQGAGPSWSQTTTTGFPSSSSPSQDTAASAASQPTNLQQGSSVPTSAQVSPTQARPTGPQASNTGRPPSVQNVAGRQDLKVPNRSNVNFAPNLSFNFNPSSGHQHQHQHQHPHQHQHQHGSTNDNSAPPPYDNTQSDANAWNNANNSSSYTDPNAGTYSTTPSNYNYNANTQSPAYYGNNQYNNAGYTNPNYGYDPNAGLYNTPTYNNIYTDGGSDGDSAFLGAALGSGLGDSGDTIDYVDPSTDPASFMGSANDVASLDPNYGSMNPGFASAGPGTPTSFLSATGNSLVGDLDDATGLNIGDSPLAGLGPSASPDIPATDALSDGLSGSPLAGLAPDNSSTSGFDTTGDTSNAFGDMDAGAGDLQSPLAGLAIQNTSTTSLQMSSGGQEISMQQTDSTSYVDEVTGDGNQSSMFMEQDTTTTFSDLGDDSDDGFGYQ